ncbi:hypothetical protein [Bradyrhizobium canariense]|uniref:hypothetical protein n=1 Tax=Bradyrhizobium canariense TaxID=255045 RepID=UPI001FCDC57E|nr:hypothetical protein [Bradyrhizobium canariense]
MIGAGSTGGGTFAGSTLSIGLIETAGLSGAGFTKEKGFSIATDRIEAAAVTVSALRTLTD